MVTHICKSCGREFQSPRRDSKYCCKACADQGLKGRKCPAVSLVCEWCGKPFEPKDHSGKRRFCGRSCSAKWRMSQPEYKVRLTPEQRVAASERMKRQSQDPAFVAARDEYLNSERNHFRDPEKRVEIQAKVHAKLRANGYAQFKGGNGRGLTVPQQMLVDALGWQPEYAVSCGKNPKARGLPSCYKIDLAEPALMIGIEVDGHSHSAAARKLEDAKKDAFLSSLGWRIIRFKNADILKDLPRVLEQIEGAVRSSTSRQAPTTTSPAGCLSTTASA